MFKVMFFVTVANPGLPKSLTETAPRCRFLNFITAGSMSSGLFEVELYGGLLMFMGYIVFDTQVLVEAFRIWSVGADGAVVRGKWTRASALLITLACTQMIIEDAHAGRKDFVAHALDLLIDLVAVFVRLLIILTRNANKKERKQRS
jgi:hypothetical protein